MVDIPIIRECVHKEILFGRWTVEDENGLRFAFCKRCWRKMRYLKGFKIIEHGESIHRKEKIMHHCHWVGCKTPVPPGLWGCRKHWFALPQQFREAIWRTYNKGQENGDVPVTQEYLDVADEIRAWIISTGKVL